VAGGELLIPTIGLLFGTDIKSPDVCPWPSRCPPCSSRSPRYSRAGSFTVLRRHARLVGVLALGSVTGTITGGLLLGVVPEAVLVPGLALLLILSSNKVWRHATGAVLTTGGGSAS
jgi:hypothetical protein